MNKSFWLIAGAVAASVLISGCGQVNIRKQGFDENMRRVMVAQTGSFTQGGTINSTNRRWLQATAEETIKSGYQSFYFMAPFELKDGSVKNTDDFLKKCADKNPFLSFITFSMASSDDDECKLFNGDARSSVGDIKMFSEGDKWINASRVIQDLKDKGYYDTLSPRYIDAMFRPVE